MSDTTQPVLVEKRDGATILTLNAPEKRNAISTEMRIQLREALQAAIADRSCTSIVLQGAGGTFCAGADVSQMVENDMVYARQRLHILHDCVRLLAAGGKPTLAAVEGHAVGAGLSLALACDFVISARNAKIGAAFAKIGLVADCGLLWTLPQKIGQAKAKDLLFSARIISGEEGAALGLADEVAEPGASLDAALRRAATYAQGAPLALAATKAALNRGASSLDDILAIESDVQLVMTCTADHAEAKQAFKEKRPPVFTGR